MASWCSHAAEGMSPPVQAGPREWLPVALARGVFPRPRPSGRAPGLLAREAGGEQGARPAQPRGAASIGMVCRGRLGVRNPGSSSAGAPAAAIPGELTGCHGEPLPVPGCAECSPMYRPVGDRSANANLSVPVVQAHDVSLEEIPAQHSLEVSGKLERCYNKLDRPEVIAARREHFCVIESCVAAGVRREPQFPTRRL